MSRQLEKLEELSRLIEAAKTMPLKEDPAYKEPEFDKLYRLWDSRTKYTERLERGYDP